MRRSVRMLLAGTTFALVSVMMSPVAYADAGLKLHPNGFGEKSQAKWASKEGLVDNNGKTNFAFYLQKQTTTATFAAGVGRVAGLEGQPVTALTGLEWQHRNDGWCGAGAPRWTIVVTGSDGNTYFVHLGCAAATHSPGDAPNWIRDSYTGAEIQAAVQAAILAQGGTLAAVSGATIDRLLIIFDEGTDIAGNPGFVYLDNITVNSKVWTGPADNGN